MALTFLLIRIFEQGFIFKLISTSILSIYGKITSPEPLTEKRRRKQFSDPPPQPYAKITVFIIIIIILLILGEIV